MSKDGKKRPAGELRARRGSRDSTTSSAGGLTENRLFLLEGSPGSGKTTLSLQFLRDGVARGETVLYIALSESLDELHASAASHGWEPRRASRCSSCRCARTSRPRTATPCSIPPRSSSPRPRRRSSPRSTASSRARLVFDSLSELRLLAENPLRYRRQILGLKQHFTKQAMTVILVDDRVGEERDTDLHSLAHGVITLERKESDYGALRRRLSVSKLRGRAFREGFHDFAIRRGGLEVFPRLVAAEHQEAFRDESLSSGLPAVDALLGGGRS